MESQREIDRLRRKIEQLETKVKHYESCFTELYCDDMYEYLLIARQEALQDRIKDILNCKTEFYRLLPEKDKTMKQILMFFEGGSVKAKKENLRNYLKENPIFRTADPKLLLQRLKLTRTYAAAFSHNDLPQTPIQDAIKESNITIEEPQEELKDEDFLE